jgi:hypothetical protein
MPYGSPFGGGSLTAIQKEQLELAFESGSVSDGGYFWVEDTSKNWTEDQWAGYPATLKTSHGEYNITVLGNIANRFGFDPPVDTGVVASVTIDDTVETGILYVECVGELIGEAGNGVQIVLARDTQDTGMDYVTWDAEAGTLTITIDSNGLGEPRDIMTGNVESLINNDVTASQLFSATMSQAGNLLEGTYVMSGGADGNMADGTYHIFKFAPPPAPV